MGFSVAAAAIAVTLSAVANDPSVVAKELDATFMRRTHDGSVQELDKATEAAVQQAPDSYDVLWRAARNKFWMADSSPEADKKRKYGKEGWDFAERAIAIDGSKAEGYYYAAINIAAYGEGVGVWQALRQGVEGKFTQRIDKAMELNAHAERSGPLVAKGRYFHSMPWPKRDLGRAKKLYKKAVERNPENLRAWYYLAQTQLKDGEAKEANETMKKVMGGAIDYDPAEGKRIQSWAKRTQDAITAELD